LVEDEVVAVADNDVTHLLYSFFLMSKMRRIEKETPPKNTQLVKQKIIFLFNKFQIPKKNV